MTPFYWFDSFGQHIYLALVVSGGGSRFRARRQKRGEDVMHMLRVSLEDLYNGTTKKLSLSRNILCRKCKGYFLSLILLNLSFADVHLLLIWPRIQSSIWMMKFVFWVWIVLFKAEDRYWISFWPLWIFEGIGWPRFQKVCVHVGYHIEILHKLDLLEEWKLIWLFAIQYEWNDNCSFPFSYLIFDEAILGKNMSQNCLGYFCA